MKKQYIAVISVLLFILPNIVMAFDKAMIEAVSIQACKDIKNNNTRKLRNNLKQNHLKVSVIKEKLVCNGESVYDFALTHNADKVAKVLRTGSVSIRDIPKTDNK